MSFTIPVVTARDAFEPAIRSRGVAYYRAGRVRVQSMTDDALHAVVRGSRRYQTSLRIGERTVTGECSCPHAEKGAHCKHLWATVLAAEDAGFFYRVGGLVKRRNDNARPRKRSERPETPRSEAAPSREDRKNEPAGQATRTRRRTKVARPTDRAKRAAPVEPPWQRPLQRIDRSQSQAGRRARSEPWPPSRELWFLLDATVAGGATVSIVLTSRRIHPDGSRGIVRPVVPTADVLETIPGAEDRELAALLLGFAEPDPRSWLTSTRTPDLNDALGRGRSTPRSRDDGALQLSGFHFRTLAPRLARTGRFLVARGGTTYELSPAHWSDGAPWELWIELRAPSSAKTAKPGKGRVFELAASLRRGEERRDVSTGDFLSNAGIGVLEGGTIVSLDTRGAAAWVELMRQQPIRIAAEQVDEFLETVYSMRAVPRFEIPPEAGWQTGEQAFQPVLRIDSVMSPYVVNPMDEDRGAGDRAELRRGHDGGKREDAGPGHAGRDRFHDRRQIGRTDNPRFNRFDRAERRARFGPLRWEMPLLGSIAFRYGNVEVAADSPRQTCVDRVKRSVVRRNLAQEQEARSTLTRMGFTPDSQQALARCQIEAELFPLAVRELLERGWRVEAHGRPYRRATTVRLQISSGVDWFDLSGCAAFGVETSVEASLLEMLEAWRRGRRIVLLGDGSLGLLPEEWLEQQGIFLELGEAEEDRIRFRRGQASVLDALLASRPEIETDTLFEQARRELQHFRGVTPLDEPPGFGGQLRPYQREALGWFEFLRRFGLGGCLADDMGLGKTVVVLAWLDRRRQDRASSALIVVPRSLVFNWKSEAERFTPSLRILDHTGAGRSLEGARNDINVVLTTYGTLRKDIEDLSKLEFDYVILDEAQAIKNSTTATAKAVRLLNARHRLALSGTPIENHLGELWSLYEFLNPGLLGPESAMRDLMRVPEGAVPGAGSNIAAGATANAGAIIGAGADSSTNQTPVLTRAIRPLLLRRTKEQVAPELPPRSEQVLVCELEAKQRKLYDELRRHYQRSLLGLVDRRGLARSKIQVLEALLRLRQAACHPGLLAPERAHEPSAKFEVLLPRIEELLEEGHKALVFSQFTTFLGLLRKELERKGLSYEYLDGKARDRAERVRRFQESNEAGLFLISLKAGGVGLNLTQADYVFLLDPWWNPAVEAQAIDRTHRIGQTRSVLAYRLIAEDTVEEKILELQKTKRALAEAVLGSGKSLLQELRREDLELLLS